MKKTGFILALIVFCASAYSQTIFQSAKHKYTIETPEFFTVSAKANADYFASGLTGSSVNVMVKELSQPITLTVEEMNKVPANVLQARLPYANAKLLTKEVLLINGKKCFHFTAVAEKSTKIWASSYTFFKGKRQYVVGFGCPFDELEAFSPIISRIMQSFKIE